jgi:TonB-linked SusC/RagA family outer membrane protein
MNSKSVWFALVMSCLVVPSVGAQQVTGRVTSTSGEPLSAVQVFIPDTGIGALSQQNGRYLLLNVPAGTHTITAQRIGYGSLSQEVVVTAGEPAIQDFTLTVQALGLDEIVVTGVAGGTRRRAVGNAVTTMNVASALETTPVRSVDDLLLGRTPGITVMGLGTVGSGGNIRIRGQTTFSLSSNPLVYIDGIRVNNSEDTGLFDDAGGGRSMMSTLDPNEIESVEVLKGPSAATLYGTEASRGVINIITKRGQQGGRTINFSVRQGTNFVGPPARDRIGGERYYTTPEGQVQTLDVLQHWADQGKDPFGYGQIQDYNFSVSGGTPSVRYFMSTSYLDEKGYVTTNWARRFNLRANTEADLGEDLRLSLSTSYSQSTNRRPKEGANNFPSQFVFGGPRFLAENFCRAQSSAVCAVSDGGGSYGQVGNIQIVDEAQDNQQGLNRFVGSGTLSYDPLPWLSTRAIMGIDFANEDNTLTVEFQSDPGIRASLRSNADGYREVLRNQRVLTTADFSATAEFPLTSSIESSASVGVQYYTRTTTSMYVRGNGFPVPGLRVVDAARQALLRRTTDAGDLILSDNRIQDRTLGLYVQETLAWKDRLFLTGAVRVDNNSAFGSEINLVTYPKASLSWVINEEDWYESVMPSWVSALRFRLAYGESGEQPPAFAAVRSYTPVPSPQGGGITTFTSGNPDLAPEVGAEVETGFDADLFEGRLGLEFTYFNTRTRDAILKRDVAPSTGFSQAVFVNLGQVTSQGLEIAIDAQPVATSWFRWNLGGHVAYNEAKIDRLGDEPSDTAIIYGIWNIREHRVGYAPHQWFGPQLVSAEWDAGQGSIVNEICDNGSGGTMGCYNADGTLAAPRLFTGHTIAPWELGLSSEFAFGESLRLHVQVISNRGHKRFDNNMRQRYGGFANTRANAYPEEADPRDLLRLAAAKSGDVIMSPFINDVSFTRIQEVALSWTLPSERLQGFGISGASLGLAARNLWTFTDWEDIDPTVNRPNGDDRMFFSQHPLPTPTTIETTLRLTF